jgi:hypothetical protein
LALVPAALVAQAPATTDFTALLKAETPGIEALLKEFKPLEAMQKSEAMIPATLPGFNKANPSAAMKDSINFSSLTRIYLLGAKAAAQAGEWEKVLDLCTKAEACAKVNYEGTKEALTPVIATWTQAIEQAKKAVADNAERIKTIQAKPGRNPQEEAEYQAFLAKDKVYNTTKVASEKNEAAKFLKANLPRFQELEAKAILPQEQQEINAYNVAQGNLTNGPKTIKLLQENIDATKAELDLCGPKITATQKNIKDEADEIAKGVAETKVKGKADKRATYFENVMKTKANYESRTNKIDRMNFAFRLRHNVAGTPLETKVNEIIERLRADQDPLPTDKKAPAAKGKKAK